MAAIARERIAREGWRNVTVVQSGAEDAQIAVTADAALFCAVHDILQSPDALRNVINHLRPGVSVAAGGGKWAAPWMAAVNLQTRMLHAPYVRSFEGFGRPWNHLEQLIDDVHVRELAFGSGYVLTGRSRRFPAVRLPGGTGRGRIAGRPRLGAQHACQVVSEAPCGRSPRRRAAARSRERSYPKALPARRPGSGCAKQSRRPSLRRTKQNHSTDAPVPATTSATVTAVESIRNIPAGSVTIRTARAAASSRKIPAHSQVAPWKKRCRPG
jgi:hypothetical protein